MILGGMMNQPRFFTFLDQDTMHLYRQDKEMWVWVFISEESKQSLIWVVN